MGYRRVSLTANPDDPILTARVLSAVIAGLDPAIYHLNQKHLFSIERRVSHAINRAYAPTTTYAAIGDRHPNNLLASASHSAA